ncbi:hypothetical protein ACJJTC_005118 [Scirpophaga incertulas]
MSNVPCPSGTNSDQFEGQVSIGSEDALADSNIPDVGSNDDVAEAISVTKRNSEISVPKPVEDPSEPTCTPIVYIYTSINEICVEFYCRTARSAPPPIGRRSLDLSEMDRLKPRVMLFTTLFLLTQTHTLFLEDPFFTTDPRSV